MTVSELIGKLRGLPGDARVLIATERSTLVEALRCGTVEVIPARTNRALRPGQEWRVPVNALDEPDAGRRLHVVIH
jgi:hypothetical protein